MKIDLDEAIVCVLGLGYVGLPLVQAFSRSLKVVGFDIDGRRIGKLRRGSNNKNLLLTDNPKEISKANFIIIAVPTPVTKAKEPDLSFVTNAARTVSQNMKKGSTVILESTLRQAHGMLASPTSRVQDNGISRSI